MQEDTTKCKRVKLCREKTNLDSRMSTLIRFTKLLESFPRNIAKVPLLTVQKNNL